MVLLLAGCTDGTSPGPAQPTGSTSAPAASPTTPDPTTAPADPSTTSASPTDSSTGPPGTTTPPAGPTASPSSPTPDDVDPALHPWQTGPTRQDPPAGAPAVGQEIVGVRTGLHDGYDRVVLDLSGSDPILGWFAGFTDEAVQDPTGEPMDVEGDAFLQLGVFGIDWTTDAPDRYSGAPVDGEGLEVVKEVVFGGLFEAQQQILIGLDDETAYRVFALSDPARIVVDIQHD